MAKKTIDQKLDNKFGWLNIVLYYSGIGVIFGLIYHLVLKFVFGKNEKLDISQGFRKQKTTTRHSAFIVSFIILIAIIIIAIYLFKFLLPLYDTKIKAWLESILELKPQIKGLGAKLIPFSK